MDRGRNRLSDSFHARFEVVLAETAELKDAVYRVRHAVYCEEFGFEPTTSAQREIDRYDACATALLIRDLHDAQFIACARIVHTNPLAPDEPLPFEIATKGRLHQEMVTADPVPRSQVGEISRLAVVSRYRRRRTDAGSPAPLSDDDFKEGPSSRFPFILAGLYLGIMAAAQLEGLVRLYMLTEERLARHINRVGVKVVPIGELVEHRGPRLPSMIDVPAVTAGFPGPIKPMYEQIRAKIAQSFPMAALS